MVVRTGLQRIFSTQQEGLGEDDAGHPKQLCHDICSPTFMVDINRKSTTPGDKTALHHVLRLLLEHSDLPTNSMPWDLLTLLPVATLARRSAGIPAKKKILQAPGFRNNRTWERNKGKKRFTTTRNHFLKKDVWAYMTRKIQRKFSA